jgi:hypothetical protein
MAAPWAAPASTGLRRMRPAAAIRSAAPTGQREDEGEGAQFD